jgi:O-methyltransferase involved in polyketide biosynthesis
MAAGDLSITALYTSQTWAWGGLTYAHLFATPEGKRVFDATNAALAVAGVLRRDFAPLRYSLLQRHALIDRLVRARGARQVLELAAGLSRRGAAFTADDPSLRYIEIDLPAVIRRKRALLDRTALGREVLARPNLRLVEGDVTDAPLDAWIDRGAPVVVIAEGLLMYLDADAQARLFARIAALGDVTFVFDLVPGAEEPPPGVVGRALGAVMTRFTGGRGFARDPRTRADLLASLRAAGFASATAIDTASVARRDGLPHPDQRTRMVVFTASTATTS